MKEQKREANIQFVRSARTLAGITLIGMVALLIHDNSQTDIGSAFGVFYLSILIAIFVFVWIVLEVKRLTKS